MELYGYEFIRETDLTHHGILGQKWGKKNGPPYPLSESKHSSAEKKAGWKKSLGKTSEKKVIRDRSSQIEKGKKIVKGIIIGAGTVAIGTAVFMTLSSSGANYGAELFDQDVFQKAVELSQKGGTIKTYLPDGRVLIPYEEYGPLIHNIMSGMTREMRRAKQFAFHFKGRVYMCENDENDVPRIVDWFTLEDWEEASWEVANG